MENKNTIGSAIFAVLFLSLFLTLSITTNNFIFAQKSTPPSIANQVTYKLHQTVMIPNMSFHATVTLPADFFQKDATPKNFKILAINGVNTLVYFINANEYIVVPLNQLLTANVDKSNPTIINFIKITTKVSVSSHTTSSNSNNNGGHARQTKQLHPTPTEQPNSNSNSNFNSNSNSNPYTHRTIVNTKPNRDTN